jgi:hypothetical protein
MNHQDATRYFLFPHSVMADLEARHLALLVPNLHLLQIINPLQMPAWAQEHFIPHIALADTALIDRVNHYLHDLRNFADTHRGSDTLVLLESEQLGRDRESSRFLLQDELRNRPAKGHDMPDWLRLEAASFLELAREMDERELELENHYRRMEDLEKGFREILGVIDGEEMEEVAETGSTHLVPDQNRLHHMLVKRSVSWYRLFGDSLVASGMAMVALTREVAAELLDPIQTDWERDGRQFNCLQRPVASLPSLRDLASSDFQVLWHQTLESGVIEPYWQALADALRQPLEENLWDKVQQQMRLVRTQIFEICMQYNFHPKEQVVLVMNHLVGVNHHDLWKRLDRTGFEHLVAMEPAAPDSVTFFHLEWGTPELIANGE